MVIHLNIKGHQFDAGELANLTIYLEQDNEEHYNISYYLKREYQCQQHFASLTRGELSLLTNVLMGYK